MKFVSPLLVVKDIDKSVHFYERVLGLKVILDFGANKTLSGGIALQTAESWSQFINTNDVRFGVNNFEIYFEEDDFDAFEKKLESLGVRYLHPVKEHSWGQRVIRFYDLDHHIIEVGENMNAVAHRFLMSGMTSRQIAKRMDVPIEYVNKLVHNKL